MGGIEGARANLHGAAKDGLRSRVEEDVRCVFERWADRSAAYAERARREFEQAVDPQAFHLTNPDLRSLMCVNLAFTEWFLFEFRLSCGLTPLEMHANHPPTGTPADRRLRLGEVARTQFFSPFAIREKLPDTGEVRLLDLQGGGEYLVQAGELCRKRNWRRGTALLRIACVGGEWVYVGRTLFYDRAPVSKTKLLPELGRGAALPLSPSSFEAPSLGSPCGEASSAGLSGIVLGGYVPDVGPSSAPPRGAGAQEPLDKTRIDGRRLRGEPPIDSCYLRFLHETIGASGSFTDTLRIVA